MTKLIRKSVAHKFKKYFNDVIEIKTSPHSIALGFAIGSFIAILPTPGFNVLIVLLLIFLYKNISKLSAFAALAFWNPIVKIPIYMMSWRIGDFIFRNDIIVEFKLTLMDQIFRYTRRYLIGNLIIAIFISIISYYLVKFIAMKYQNRQY